MAYLDIFIDEFTYFSPFPYSIYDHLKCVSWLHATLCMFKMLRGLSYVIHFLVHSVGQSMSENRGQYEIPFLKLRAVCSEC